MKNILIFANPFGYGPSGKALAIANYIYHNSKGVTIFLCGSAHLKSITPAVYNFIEVDDRDDKEILKLLNTIVSPQYVISSQNRFAIKAAKTKGIPCAFLDGLSWFWPVIPAEHFDADIVFWLNYPHIRGKIPDQYKDKLKIIHGIVDKENPIIKRSRKGILLYIGGCTNPLTGLPTSYLDLVAHSISIFKKNHVNIRVACDGNSRIYLQKYRNIRNLVKTYDYCEFQEELKKSSLFITNGGQTATLEAVKAETPISFFLPINLSQFALINKINNLLNLNWSKYINLPKNFLLDSSEKTAIETLNNASKRILDNQIKLESFSKDLLLLFKNSKKSKTTNFIFFNQLGMSGAEDIFNYLKEKWSL